jgi:hypothetical protein
VTICKLFRLRVEEQAAGWIEEGRSKWTNHTMGKSAKKKKGAAAVQIPAAREEQESGPATMEDGDGENKAAAGGKPGPSDDGREEPRSSSPTSPGGLTPPGSPTPSEPSTPRVRHPTAALRQRAEQEAGLCPFAFSVQRVGGNVLCGLHGGHVPCVRACAYKKVYT